MNKYPQGPDLLVLPEDDANRKIVSGFLKHLKVNLRAIQLLPNAGGWRKAAKVVDESKEQIYISEMRKFLNRRIVLLIDFDEKGAKRLNYVQNQIPSDLKERVFVLGTSSNPEALKRELNLSFEKIGETLAQECADNRNELWGHELLKHNQPGLERMILSVKPFLFSSS